MAKWLWGSCRPEAVVHLGKHSRLLTALLCTQHPIYTCAVCSFGLCVHRGPFGNWKPKGVTLWFQQFLIPTLLPTIHCYSWWQRQRTGCGGHKVFSCTQGVFFPSLLALLPTNNVAKLRLTNLQMRAVFGASGLIWDFNEGLSALMDARGTDLHEFRAVKHTNELISTARQRKFLNIHLNISLFWKVGNFSRKKLRWKERKKKQPTNLIVQPGN